MHNEAENTPEPILHHDERNIKSLFGGFDNLSGSVACINSLGVGLDESAGAPDGRVEQDTAALALARTGRPGRQRGIMCAKFGIVTRRRPVVQ